MDYNINTDELKRFIGGREIEIAKQLGILTDGKGKEYHQYCPFCPKEEQKSGERFYIRMGEKTSFHCRQNCFNGDLFALVQRAHCVDFNEAKRLIADTVGFVNTGIAQKKVAPPKEWIYTDSDGNPVYKVVRKDTKKGKHFFQQRHENGTWKSGLNGIKPLPLNLSALMANHQHSETPFSVFIVEGERCTDAVNTLKIGIGTTSSGGSNSTIDWTDYADIFQDLPEVVVFTDNDKPGYEYALKTANQLRNAGGCNVKVVFLCEPKEKELGYDISDWIAEFGDSESAAERLATILENTPFWDGVPFYFPNVGAEQSTKTESVFAETSVPRVKITLCSDIESAEPKWLLPNLIPKDGLTFITGAPGVGKTYWTCLLSSLITNGYEWEGHPIEKGSVLFLEGESTKSVFVRRLENNGVDLKQCGILEGKEIYCKDTKQWHLDPVIFQDLCFIEKSIDEMEAKTGRRVGALVADPVGNFYGTADSYKDTEVRRLLMPMKQIAEKREIAFVLVGHHGKTQHVHSQNQALGSVGQGGVARSHCQIYIDREDKELRYFAPSKVNDATEYKSVSYRIVKPLGEVQIVSTGIDKQADDFMQEQRQGQNGRPPQELESATDWLRDFLDGGKKPSSEVFEVAKEAEGFSKSTVDRAKKELGIKPKQGEGKWWWELPDTAGDF